MENIIGKIIDTEKGHRVVPSIYVGEGNLEDGRKFEIATTWGSEPIIIFEGRYYVLKWSDICDLADKAGLFDKDDKKETI